MLYLAPALVSYINTFIVCRGGPDRELHTIRTPIWHDVSIYVSCILGSYICAISFEMSMFTLWYYLDSAVECWVDIYFALVFDVGILALGYDAGV